MKTTFSIITVLFASLFFSQTHRFIYQMDIKFGDQPLKMNMVLDIDKDYAKFYDYEFLKMDSISKKKGENWQTNTMSDQLILRKLNTFDNKEFHDNFSNYFVMDSQDKMDWKIESETKKSGEYPLQKATTDFGGRSWVAWFSSAIPFQEGPYKFRGLPGLIFELNDLDNNFRYSLIKSTNLNETFDTNNFLETHYGNKAVPVTLAQYNKVKLDYYADPVAELSQMLKNGGIVKIGDENITTQAQLDQKRKFLQEMIKKYYNPVRLDRAIPYPKN